jgi:hypothetical protein
MIWGKKKAERQKKELLAHAARQPVPAPPVKTTEIRSGIKNPNLDFFRKQKIKNTFLDGPRPAGLPKGIAWGIGGIVVIFVAGFVISFFWAKHELAHSIATHSATLSAGIKALQNFDPQGAEQEFRALGIATSGTQDLLGALGSIFQNGGGAFASFADISKQLVLLPQEYEALQSDVFSGINPSAQVGATSSTGLGVNSAFSTDLVALQNTVDALDNDTDQVSSGITSFGSSAALGGENYIALKSELHGARQFLDKFAPWVGASTPHHVLVLFENSAELRPGGGFLGSYADVTIANGAIADIAVHDVADVDSGFTQNIVPPLALQPEISRFRPADTNWFFDFPTSASKTIAFFEASNLYSGTATSTPSLTALTPSHASTSFDGVIAVSPSVVSDLLSVTGPITISASSTATGNAVSTTFTSANFLVQIQKLVQDGQAQSATYPKQVLRDLANAMFTQLASSTDADRQGLFSMVLGWVNQKDVMAYFSDPGFENFLKTYGAAGDVYGIPQNFNGDYLAAIDANVNGGKSDLYVSSTVAWQSQIGTDGTIDDSVIIDRAHHGDTSPYWWYQVTNQDYLQLFVPDGSMLTNESGGAAKKITPKVNYTKLGYAVDSTIATIESSAQTLFGYPAVTSHEESGKEVFATWVTTKSGASSTVSFDYSHHAFSLPTSGTAYQFIFEKQASTARHYSFEFDAPIGYQFAENKLPSYYYDSDDPPGRLVITLTLEKI